MKSSVKVLFAAAEVVPFAKTGGLADVAGALPKVLSEMGYDVRIVMPRYSSIDGKKYGLCPMAQPFRIPHGNDSIEVAIEVSTAIEGVPTLFINDDNLYDRDTLYGQPDDDHRFVAYCRAIMEMCRQMDWYPDIIHCNDWHTGLVPVYLKTLYANDPGFKDTASLYTIHNLAYQGTFGPHILDIAGLPRELFTWDRLEFWGTFNFMKAGLIYADALNTVSETYANEIQSEEFGEGLQGVLAFRRDDLYGIINGIDYSVWDPRTDEYLPANFSDDDLEGKSVCKEELQQEVGLPKNRETPLIGIVTRLSAQKGLDIIEAALPKLLENEDFQLVVLGTGDEHYENMMERLSKQYPDKLALLLKFDNALAHRIYAGSDMFLMPSHYEPCGLGQMISMAYGTIPVVRATGGLADTVKEFKNSNRSRGNGYLFEGYDPSALVATLQRALKCYQQKPDCWQKVVQNAFESDFSWESSAKKYVRVYKIAISSVTANQQARVA